MHIRQLATDLLDLLIGKRRGFLINNAFFWSAMAGSTPCMFEGIDAGMLAEGGVAMPFGTPPGIVLIGPDEDLLPLPSFE